MGRFDSIYPFTTENIAGYMEALDLCNQRVITVAGSTDHILNAISRGCLDITTFDVNPRTKYYMELKLAGLRELSFEQFLQFFLIPSEYSFDYSTFCSFNLEAESKMFFQEEFSKYSCQGLNMKESSLFQQAYFKPESKIKQNLYLEEESYYMVQERLKKTNIQFCSTDVKDLVLEEEYDYMFLSNISDYLSLLYPELTLESYKNLLSQFSEKVSTIYFAYLYDINSCHPRSRIDSLSQVQEIFGDIEIERFPSALEGFKDREDGVLILKKGGKKNVGK